MGIEYRLRFAAQSAEVVAAVLRRMPQATKALSSGDRFDLGPEGDGGPQATVQIEAGGVYFCDHCRGDGRALLGEVVARLVSSFGAVAVDEL